jgi:hypothetical protein
VVVVELLQAVLEAQEGQALVVTAQVLDRLPQEMEPQIVVLAAAEVGIQPPQERQAAPAVPAWSSLRSQIQKPQPSLVG